MCLGFYSYFLNALGPATPFLRTDLRLSYATGSLHTTAFALGMVVARLGGERVIRRRGSRGAFVLAAGGIAAGAVLLIVGRSPLLTIGGALLMGTLGTLILVLVPVLIVATFAASRIARRATEDGQDTAAVRLVNRGVPYSPRAK